MTTRPSVDRTLAAIGRTARRVDRWAATRHRHRRDARLAELGVFDGTRFGYRYRLGGMGRLAQYRASWWNDLLVAAEAATAPTIVVRTDQVRWVVNHLEPPVHGEPH